MPLIKKTFKKLTPLLISFILALGLSFSLGSLLAAWVPPDSNPPGGNVVAPVTPDASGDVVINGNLGVAEDFLVGTDAFYVDQTNGRVGIGDITPEQKLSVDSGSTYGIASFFAPSSDFGEIYFGKLIGSQQAGGYNKAGALGYIPYKATDPNNSGFLFMQAYGEPWGTFVIKDGGNVGIGTRDPKAKLHLYADSSSADGVLRLEHSTNDSTTSAFDIQFKNTAATASGYAGIRVSNPSSNVTNMEFSNWDGSARKVRMGIYGIKGDVGIGTTGPGYSLHVMDNDGTAVVNIDSNDSTNYWTGLRLARQGSEKWFLGVNSSDNKLLFRRDNDSNDLMIDSSGNVGIGIVAPSSGLKLDVEGNVGAQKYCDENGNNCKTITELSGSALPRGVYLGMTTSSYNGNLGGLAGASTKCSMDFPDSRLCSLSELASLPGPYIDLNGWVAPSIQGKNCSTWADGTNNVAGTFANRTTNNWSESTCVGSFKLHCCR